MTNRVHGPVRTLAVQLRDLADGSKEGSFKLARRILRTLNDHEFVVRKADQVEAKEDGDLLQCFVKDIESLVDGEVPPILKKALAEQKKKNKSKKASPQYEAPPPPAPAPEPVAPPVPAAPVALDGSPLDLELVRDCALDALDALSDHRPDLAREDVTALLQALGAMPAEAG